MEVLKEKTSTKKHTFEPQRKTEHQSAFKPKKWAWLAVLLVLMVAGLIYEIAEEPSNEEKLAELTQKLAQEGGLPLGDYKDYCQLMAVLRDSIPTDCVCVLDGIDWNNPPKSPEELPDEWEEVTDPRNGSGRKEFAHKKYPKIIIGFDAKDQNGRDRPHWHRYHPYRSRKDYYLDIDCNSLNRGHKHSHIYVKH
jgi:hypothetical protein